MAKVMGNLRRLCEETLRAVVVVHHQRKSGGGGGDKQIHKGETLRGYSSIEAALDLALLIERREREESIAVIPTKVRDYQEFGISGAHFAYQHREGTKQIESARFFSKSIETADEVLNLAIKVHIKQELRGVARMKQGDLVNAVRDMMAALPGGKPPGINKIRGLLRALVEDRLVVTDSDSTTKSYRLL